MFKRAISLVLVVASLLLIALPSITLPAEALSYSGSSSYKSGKYYTRLTNIALTGDQRKDIVAVAESQIGYQEGGSSSQLSGTVKGSGNYTEYGRWYGMQDMWCAMFVSWCASVAGIPTSVVTSHSYTPTGLNWFRNKGQAYSRATVASGGYTPQPGDIIYFKSSRNQNITNHVGIVTSYSNGTVYTIEGNTSSATISTNGGAVCAKSYSISNTYIVYICSPSYTAPVVEETPAVDPWRDVVFDAGFYASKYSDARESCGSDFDALYNHYKTVGVPEGRQGSPNFDVKYYLDHNPHVQQIINSTTNYQAAYDYFVSSGYLDIALTAQTADLGEHFYARIQMTPGKNLSLSGNNVILYHASELPAQIWEFIRQPGGSYKIVNAKYGLTLSVQDQSKYSGANVLTAMDTGELSQRWFIYEYNGRYMLRPYNSAFCVLDVYGGYTDDLTNIEIYAANRSVAQMFDICKFDYTGAEYAVDLGQDLYVKINNYASGTYLTNASTNVTCEPNTNSAISVWRLIHQDDGSYRIIGQNTRLDMMAQDGADGNGVNVNMQYDYDAGLAAQRWYIYRCHHGYTLRASHSSATRLAVESVSPTSGVNVQLGTVAGDDKQIFTITEIDYLKEVAPQNLGDDFYAKVRYYAGGTYMSLSNVNVITYTSSSANAQLWRFIRQENGSYKIINQKTGMLLDSLDVNAEDGTNVRTRTQEFAVTSGWYIYGVGGLNAFRSADTEDLMVTVEAGSSAPETNIHLGTFTGRSAQRFMLEKVDFYDAVKPVDLGDTFYSKITNIASGKNVGLNSDGGVNVVLSSNSDAANQTWKFVRQSDGSYEIINQGNGFLLNTSGGSSAPGTNINTRGDEDLTQQRWFIYLKEGNYILQPACAASCLLTVKDGSYADGTNIQTETATFSEAQQFCIISDICGESVNAVGVTDEQMGVLRKIMYAVETGGQVYGNADYSDFTEAYTNTSLEHAITIGAGQWYGPEAKSLLSRIRDADNELFASLDTEGIGADLDSADWSSYQLSKSSAKAKCIVAIISTDVGISIQDQMIDEQMISFMQEAKNLGVTDIDALMMCANIRHLGGLSALKRILNKTATPYTLDNIYAAMQTDTGNQVGAFTSRNAFVKKYLNMYIPAEPIAAEHSFGYIKVDTVPTCDHAGLTFYLCNNCNYVKKEITAPSAHAWIDATCGSAKICGTCGLTEGEPLGHSYDAGKITTDPTCTEDGVKTFTCGTCGNTKTESVAASGHDYKAVVTDPTCTEGGYTTYTCACGDKYTTDEVAALGHSYDAGKITTDPTCTVNGVKTYTCGTCGNTKTESVAASGHDYKAVVTAPTCTKAGYTTYTCACGDKYTADEVAALGHSYDAGKITTDPTCTVNGVKTYTCGTCGNTKTESVAASGHDYKAVVTAPTCTKAGYTTYTCVCGDKYTADEVAALGHSYDEGKITTDPTCTVDGVKTYTCGTCGNTKTESVAASGHNYVDGTCVNCGAADPDYVAPITKPTVSLSYPTLNFKDIVYYNIYYQVNDMTDVVEMGLITFDGALSAGTIDDATEVIAGYVASGSNYMVHTNGINAKNLGDALYFKVYAKLSDGSYVYSDLAGYHAVAYAKDILANSTNAKMKSLVVAMLNYGAAAQVQFNYKTDSLMNSFLTEEQKALVADYSADMVAPVTKVDSSKIGAFAYNGGYSALYPTVSFEGAFSINYYFAPSNTVDGQLTFYYWTAEDYAKASLLTTKNATGTIPMTKDDASGVYHAVVADIAARQLSETVYVAGVYTSGGNFYCTGVIAYSLGAYCLDRVTNGTGNMPAFAQATVVYGYYAKDYFAN